MTALEFSYALTQSTKALKPFALRLTKDSDDAADLLQEQTLNSEKSIMDRHSPMLLFIQVSLKRS
jgi:RNA polymerase sigma-70 factor (ECF subfamily)